MNAPANLYYDHDQSAPPPGLDWLGDWLLTFTPQPVAGLPARRPGMAWQTAWSGACLLYTSRCV